MLCLSNVEWFTFHVAYEYALWNRIAQDSREKNVQQVESRRGYCFRHHHRRRCRRYLPSSLRLHLQPFKAVTFRWRAQPQLHLNSINELMHFPVNGSFGRTVGRLFFNVKLLIFILLLPVDVVSLPSHSHRYFVMSIQFWLNGTRKKKNRIIRIWYGFSRPNGIIRNFFVFTFPFYCYSIRAFHDWFGFVFWGWWFPFLIIVCTLQIMACHNIRRLKHVENR